MIATVSFAVSKRISFTVERDFSKPPECLIHMSSKHKEAVLRSLELVEDSSSAVPSSPMSPGSMSAKSTPHKKRPLEEPIENSPAPTYLDFVVFGEPDGSIRHSGEPTPADAPRVPRSRRRLSMSNVDTTLLFEPTAPATHEQAYPYVPWTENLVATRFDDRFAETINALLNGY